MQSLVIAVQSGKAAPPRASPTGDVMGGGLHVQGDGTTRSWPRGHATVPIWAERRARTTAIIDKGYGVSLHSQKLQM